MSPSPEQIEYAQLLLRRASGDLEACRVLARVSEIDEATVGFHAQQAVEKSLKVALVLADVELPRTHDLDLLVELARDSGANVPEAFAEIDWLTPWAAELRYDEPVGLDRSAALKAAEHATAWAASLIAEA